MHSRGEQEEMDRDYQQHSGRAYRRGHTATDIQMQQFRGNEPMERHGGFSVEDPADYSDTVSFTEPNESTPEPLYSYQNQQNLPKKRGIEHHAGYPESSIESDSHQVKRLHEDQQSALEDKNYNSTNFIPHRPSLQKAHTDVSSEHFSSRPDGAKHYDYVNTREAGEGNAVEDLLKYLPSRQLDALAAGNMPKTMRTKHSRKASNIHGTVRWQKSPIQDEQIDSMFAQEMIDPAEEEKVEETIRSMPTTMSNRRKMKKRISLKKKTAPGRWKRMKYSIGMSWLHSKYRMANLMYGLELWRLPLKQIQGHFGTGVLSYFVFLKWLLLINIPTLLCTLSFLVLPQVLYRWRQKDPGGYAGHNKTDFTGIELLTGAGWFTDTELYYGFYTNETINIQSGHQYDMKLAYLFTCGGYYFLTLIILGQSILQSYRKYYIETSGTYSLYYINKVLGSWDYGITSSEGVKLQHLSFFNEIKEYLIGTGRQTQEKTRKEWCQVFLLRVLMNLLVLGMVVAAGYLIYFLSTERMQTNRMKENNTLDLVILPLCIGVCDLVLPVIFSTISHYERYDKPRYALYMDLFRSMLLRSALLGVLVYFWYNKVAVVRNFCWETFVGQEIYRLVVIDFLIALIGTFLSEFVRRLLAKRIKQLTAPEFSTGRYTLELIYLQGLCWVGTFFSPLLPFMVIIVLIVVFYVKKTSVLQNCKPSVRPWRAARSHTIFLGFLFVFFLFAAVSVACGIIFIEPSENCGPYRGQALMYNVVVQLLELWKKVVPVLSSIIRFISSPGFLSAVLVILCIITYYVRILAIGRKETVRRLKEQVMLEGKDKTFLLTLLSQLSAQTQISKPKGAVNHQSVLGDTDVRSPGGRNFVRSRVESAAAAAGGS